MANWNPWHGCKKLSPGCANCYVYRGDSRRGLDAAQVYRTKTYDLPLQKKRDGSWKDRKSVVEGKSVCSTV